MCSFGADTSGAEAAAARAKKESLQAMQTQLEARVNASSAADTNSESTRLSNEAALRRLAAGGMFGAGMGGAAPAPNVATRMLVGD